MKEEEIISFKKQIILSDNEDEDENNYIENYDSDSYFHDKNDNDFYNQTINILQKNILEYINNKNLPIGEYLSLETIKKFLSKIPNF
jgi:hypothetical protein